MVLKALVHLALELGDVLEEEFLLDSTEVAKGRVVRAKELVQAIDMLHVVLLLEGDVNNSGRNVLADAVKELSLTNDDAQIRVEVNLVVLSILASEDRALQLLDGFVRLDLMP